MSAVEWEDPRPSGRGGATLFSSVVVAELRANPGRWACVKRGHRGTAALAGFVKRHPDFEGTSRKNLDGTFDLYARYVGGAS